MSKPLRNDQRRKRDSSGTDSRRNDDDNSERLYSTTSSSSSNNDQWSRRRGGGGGRGAGAADQYHQNHHRYSQDPYDIRRGAANADDIIAEESRGRSGPQRSQNGWVLFVSGLNDETQGEDILEEFSEYGQIQSLKFNLDPRTGLCKGYVLVEFNEKSEAQDAINALHGTELLGKTVRVNWAFVGDGTGESSMGAGGETKKFKR